jgi:hypothetical protein
MPMIEISADFVNSPTVITRTWTDITTDVRSASWTQSGLNDFLQRPAAGSLSMVLDNTSGDYDPTNISSPYYGHVEREIPIRVQAYWNGNVYPRFWGYVSAWTPSWPQSGNDSIVTLTGFDLLALLNILDIGGTDIPAQDTGSQAYAVMVAAYGATVANANLVYDIGVSQAIDSGILAAGTTAMSYLGSLLDTENGRLYVGGEGYLHFESRTHRMTAAHSITPQLVLGENAGEVPYRTADLEYNDTNIWNHAIVTTQDGVNSISDNAASQARFFQRTISRNVLNNNHTEALACGGWLTNLYGDPAPKLPPLELLPTEAMSMVLGHPTPAIAWDAVLGLTNGARVAFKRRPRYGGTIAIDQFVEQITETVVPGFYSTSLITLPTQDQQMWVLGDSLQGIMNESSKAGY